MSLKMKFFRRTVGYTLFDHRKNEDIFEVESRTSLWETKKIQIGLAMTCNKNEQQDAKSNAEL